jgi:hypothetical protein
MSTRDRLAAARDFKGLGVGVQDLKGTFGWASPPTPNP